MTRFIFISLCIFIAAAINHAVYAQDIPALGNYAVNITVTEQVFEGDIISITKEGFIRARTAYEAQIYGVVASSPIISLLPRNETTTPVITTGDAKVRVSAKNGAIEIGDIITSSEEPGIGQKATEGGYALGKSLQAYDSNEIGLIPIAVDISYLQGSQTSKLTGRIAQLISTPEIADNLLRYILAAIVVILTLLVSSIAFIKFLNTGLEAIGRNPLAKRTIIAGMVLSGAAVSVLALGGIALAFAIINLGR